MEEYKIPLTERNPEQLKSDRERYSLIIDFHKNNPLGNEERNKDYIQLLEIENSFTKHELGEITLSNEDIMALNFLKLTLDGILFPPRLPNGRKWGKGLEKEITG